MSPVPLLGWMSCVVIAEPKTLEISVANYSPPSSPVAPFSAALQRPGPGGSQDGAGAVSRRQLPQAIAHRGYKMAYPENSMAAFRSAVEIGAHAIETDLHLSRDGVVVLSHDGTLKRCFDEELRVAECDWSYLSTLRTTRKPHEPMPRLVDLLEYLAQPGQEHVWVLLDIKKDDEPTELISRVAATFASVPTKGDWHKRIIMGCWDAKYARLCNEILPDFPLAHIGWSLSYARELLAVPQMNFNLFVYSLVGAHGTKFLRAARDAGRSVFVWTVNDDEWMKWSIRKGVDGVITDNPERFLQICKEWPDDEDEKAAERRQMRHFFSLRRPKPLLFLLLFRVLATSVALVWFLRAGTPRQRVHNALRGH
ncbi:glycerophosphoryl diester phosphodiesterase [Apiospora saccharicola]